MPLNSKYRFLSLEELEALRSSTLLQIKQIEAVGQSHSINGRAQSAASLQVLTEQLADIASAMDWLRSSANRGNKGYTSRYADFS
jgi:hypothetical protein